jgi:hypothetical protein
MGYKQASKPEGEQEIPATPLLLDRQTDVHPLMAYAIEYEYGVGEALSSVAHNQS